MSFPFVDTRHVLGSDDCVSFFFLCPVPPLSLSSFGFGRRRDAFLWPGKKFLPSPVGSTRVRPPSKLVTVVVVEDSAALAGAPSCVAQGIPAATEDAVS
jgi:hypothetical protein